MRSRLTLLLASVVTAGLLGLTCGGEAMGQAAQGQNGTQGNPAGQAGAGAPNPYTPNPNGANPYTANPVQTPAPYSTGPYTGNKAGFYESGGPNGANAHKWTPPPPRFKSLYPKGDPNNPGADDNPDPEDANGVDMNRQGLGGLAGDTKDTITDTSHSLTYFEPKVYYWCRGQDANSANVYYSDSLAEEMSEYPPDYAKQFSDFVKTKYGIPLINSQCYPSDDQYSAKRDSDHSRSSDQFTNKTVVNTLWSGNLKSN